MDEDSADISQDVFLDLARQERCGFPEAIFGEGKTAEQLVEIASIQLAAGTAVFITRISSEHADYLNDRIAGTYNPVARTFYIECKSKEPANSSGVELDRSLIGYVPILAAGTTDLPVVEEAAETLNWMGIRSRKIMDVGVAGPHRLREKLDLLENADAVVVVAGMEGALPSVVAGYVDCPVIAVPTSVGYGANLGGVSALLSMLNSCAPNVAVVNIDAGFKGGYTAGLIASRANRDSRQSKQTIVKELEHPESTLVMESGNGKNHG